MDDKSFIFYESYERSLRSLPDSERLAMYDAIAEYGLYGCVPEFENAILNAIFALIQPLIDRANRRYEVARENGKKGGAPNGNTNARKPDETTKKQPKNNLNVNVNVNDNIKDKKKSVSKAYAREKKEIPTIVDVCDFCHDNGLTKVDPVYFFNYYTSIGWKHGRSRIDWKGVLKCWNEKGAEAY